MAVRILVADDHAVVRRGLRALLEMQTGFIICAEAEDGREAVDLAVKHKPDIAVIDVSLPVLNGIEVTRQIHKRLPLTEVLMFTLYDDEDMIGQALRAGARGYLHKAEADEHLVKAVAALAQHQLFLTNAASETLLNGAVLGPVLTPRECEVVQLIAEGNTNKMVARALDISVKTTEGHRAAAMRKLSLDSTAALVRYAVRARLTKP